jgi:hypothetical protein
MKKNYIAIYFFFAISIVFSFHTYAQTYEKNAKESKEDFVKRILPVNASIQFKVIENKFNSPGKKIIFFFKKLAMDSSINDSVKVECMFVNILIPENETSNKYSLQTLKIDCNREFGITLDDAIAEKDKQKNPYISILFCQLTRKSTALLIKTYKTFHLKQTSENIFTIEEVKE